MTGPSTKTLAYLFSLDEIRTSVLHTLVEEANGDRRGRGDRVEAIMKLVEKWGEVRYELGHDQGWQDTLDRSDV